MYSCVAGFVELGESAENAAVRECYEETRVRCGPARLVGSQPWPVGRGGGCELMLGCIARALDEPGAEEVDVNGGGGGGGGELSEARWFTRTEVASMLERSAGGGTGAAGSGAGAGTSAGASASAAAGGAEAPPLLCAPTRLAIAHALMRRWVDGSLTM